MNVYEFNSYEEFIRALGEKHAGNVTRVMNDNFYADLDKWKLGKAQYEYIKKILKKED